MIFYYSATGNSHWIATRVAEALDDQAVNILGEDPKEYRFTEEDRVGFVWLVFSCVAPETMVRFACAIRPNGAYTFSICNYSNFSDHASAFFSRDALHMDSTWGLIMPDNTLVFGSQYDTEETTLARLVEQNFFEAMKEENRDPNTNQTEKIIGLLKEKPEMTENLLNLLSMMVS